MAGRVYPRDEVALARQRRADPSIKSHVQGRSSLAGGASLPQCVTPGLTTGDAYDDPLGNILRSFEVELLARLQFIRSWLLVVGLPRVLVLILC